MIKEDLINFLQKKIYITQKMKCDSTDTDEIAQFNVMKDLTLSIYQDLLERVTSGNYE